MKIKAFTLAELMIVMLVVAIILAATAPIITKRRKVVNDTNPWQWAENHIDAYYGQRGNQTAMIGQTQKSEGDSDYTPKLIINTNGSGGDHILFKDGNDYLAQLWLHDENTMLGRGFTELPGLLPRGQRNTAFGAFSLSNLGIGVLSGGQNNVAVGYYALNENNGGSFNMAIGNYALYNNRTADSNVAVGDHALYNNIGGGNVKDGVGNIAVGAYALYGGNGSTAYYNVAMGVEALKLLTTGAGNAAIGFKSLQSLTNGSNNTAIGQLALQSLTNDSNNTAIGQQALQPLTSGSNNTAIGDLALQSLTSGSNNTAIGKQACYNLTSGSNKTCIGNGSIAYPETVGDTNEVVTLGTSSGTVYIPGDLVVEGDVVLANHSGDVILDGYKFSGVDSTGLMKGDISGSVTLMGKTYKSDRRLKNLKGEDKAGLDKIRQLKVFDYTFKKDKDKTPHVGVVAQDLQKVFPNAVTKGADGYLQIRMEDMFYAIVNAIKELDKTLQALEKKIDTLITQQKENTQRIDTLEQQVKNLSLGVPAETKLHCLGPVCVIGK